jgi:hypothetical protein
VLEQQLRDAPALVRVLHQEGDLGLHRPGRSVGDLVEPADRILLATVSTKATRSWWSTWVNRSTSRADSRGIGAKKRMYFDSAETCS